MAEMDHTAEAAVSCILFPAKSKDDSSQTRYLELFVSDNYSIGKLIRSGRDAVYGLGSAGERIYDAKAVRQDIRTIGQHLGAYKAEGASPRVLAHQGHGNIGLNNWAVAYIGTPQGQERLIVPAGEPLHERIYPCFASTKCDGKTHYDIHDLVFFGQAGGHTEIVDWVPDLGPQGAMLTEDPDREFEGDSVFIPIWESEYQGRALTLTHHNSRINWNGFGARFAKVPRRPDGTIDAVGLRMVPTEISDGERQLETIRPLKTPLEKVNYAFFGIPVEGLVSSSAFAPTPPLSAADLAHYFYDLRHLFDLIGVGTPEFYLLEYAMKKDDFAAARQLLNHGTPEPLAVDLNDLINKLDPSADSAVRATLQGFLINKGSLDSKLFSKGYVKVNDLDDITRPGDFWIDAPSPGRLVLRLLPRRNCYSYSFIGLVGPKKDRHVLLAVTGGHGGLRPRDLNGRSIFSGPVRTSFELEEAVRRILGDAVIRKWGHNEAGDGGNRDHDRLLLLDQGGDVHQWIATGGVNYVLGSSLDRSQLSGMLAILEEV